MIDNILRSYTNQRQARNIFKRENALFFIKVVRPYQKGIVERMGQYRYTADSGLKFILPFVDQMLKVDMREQVVDVPPQAVITKDNVAVDVDAVVYYEVVDPLKVIYKVADFYSAVTKLAQTSLRNLIGDLVLDESLTSREVINTQLREILDHATDKWGVNVTRVELQRIEPPKDVTDAMHRQMKAERDRRAAILTSEGLKESQILEAEGQKRAAILKAEGEGEAIKKVAEGEKHRARTIAEGEAEAIHEVFSAIQAESPTQELITLKYLETLQKMANGQSTKVFLPYEASGILSSLAGIGEMMNGQNGKAIFNGEEPTQMEGTTPQTEQPWHAINDN
ncbi:SPFH/Band 7/PHB domain protein [Chloroflexi bacterium TSY]|nr:SPFH/Band 7/PHB domain protein [Chloroflexi bacterium TSY]